MKTKVKFTISEIDNKLFAIPENTDEVSFNGVFEVNETSVFILKCLEENISKDILLDKVMTEFSSDMNEALESVEIIVEGLKKINLINDD